MDPALENHQRIAALIINEKENNFVIIDLNLINKKSSIEHFK